MQSEISNSGWGQPPWTVSYRPVRHALPESTDFAIVGGGFSGLATAAWLGRIAPGKSVSVFESGCIGAGSSGQTGGMVLAETAAGDLPGLGDVLQGYANILKELEIDCDLTLPGVWEIGRAATLPKSSISWTDSGNLRAIREVPGGSVDPGMAIDGLARAAERNGARIFENTPVENADFENHPVRLSVPGGSVRAKSVLFATNAMSLELSGHSQSAAPKFTLAVATEPLHSAQIQSLGLADRRPFYTIDFPYLWGRLLRTGSIVFGAGLVHMEDWRELFRTNVAAGEAGELIARLERRVSGLHPALHKVNFTHRWGGPILIANEWRPIFSRHPRCPQAIVLGGFSGHGVAQSVYLGAWAAEALCGRRALPDWKFAPDAT